MRLSELLDMPVLQKLAEANYKANRMPIGIVDALDGSILVGVGWQDICLRFHRANAATRERCRESDDFIKARVSLATPCEYTCKNGLRDIGIPIQVADAHLATLFLGQFFYEGERPDRSFFVDQARRFGFDEAAYLDALDRVPVFSRAEVENILQYDQALARFISELAERALAQARHEQSLREADRGKTEFIAVLSHELRNPLAPIHNALHLLGSGRADGETSRRALEVAKRQTRHLARLVDDCLDVVRLAHGRYQLRRERLDLVQLVRNSVEDHRAMVSDRGIALTVDSVLGPLCVDGDAARLSQVLGNLLRNAGDFTPPGGRVVVTLERSGDRAVLRVEDDGTGISPDVMARLFEPFVQSDRSLDRSRGGLGLGLAVVKSLVELHGGAVRAASDGEGRGSAFTVSLPLAEELAPRTSPPADRRGERRRVLVVEDNEDAAATLRDVLELDGHEVHVAADGLEGVAAALRLRPDVVLCDIGLPGIDGYEVARRIRSEDAAATLVAVTGYASPEDARRALSAGFQQHFGKPVELAELSRVVAAAPAVPRASA